MLFALICTDKPNSLELRQQSRPEHLKFLEGLGNSLKAAGPFTDDEGKPTGTLAVIEAVNRTAITEIAGRDPYAVAGLFASVEIKPWKWLIKNPEAQ
jgi:uncharacterized protein YciI